MLQNNQNGDKEEVLNKNEARQARSGFNIRVLLISTGLIAALAVVYLLIA